MKSLTPRLASAIAEIPYDVFGGELNNVPTDVAKLFEFDTKFKVLKATSHLIGLVKQTTKFAVIAEGRKGSLYADSLVISFRGTEKIIGDIITDGNLGLTGTSSGHIVHAGFENCFNSVRPQIESYILSYKKTYRTRPKVIHCVGHSLGGAVASLAAEWLKCTYHSRVHLYTFGAPRVGFLPFARGVGSEIEKTYRCTHGADPVPMVPLWPFIHGGNEYRLDRSTGIYGCAHGLSSTATPGYLNTANTQDWGGLEYASNIYLHQPVILSYFNRHNAHFNSGWVAKISSAILTLLKLSGQAHRAQAYMTAGMTCWDLLAKLLHSISKMKDKYADHLRGILGHMNVMSGNLALDMSHLTYSIIKNCFSRFIRKLKQYVGHALNFAN
ncbi:MULTISPECIES: lipase family protein [unclassified Vibrio]|uniref:lipase family protein n=1 Tax=unclassified Vibrio TaxID=2614977 RepID=UPI0025521C63|nr:lipase family protein [Vibrio sp. D406a]MDK9778363.1 lipase family protein [Vibrio sp. D401a]MDK9802810.1 lipase family protein [Vibrio sp. D406a]